MELLSSSPFSAATVCVLSVIVAVIPLWAVKMVNALWLRPKRLEKLLRAQGLHGDPYSLSPPTSNQNQSEVQQQKPDSESFALSDDVAPRLSTSLYYTIAKYGTLLPNILNYCHRKDPFGRVVNLIFNIYGIR